VNVANEDYNNMREALDNLATQQAASGQTATKMTVLKVDNLDAL
jgi:hypothetical protein